MCCLGWFEYDDGQFAKVPKFCALYECFGEKRLNDHLLVGLETLFPILIDEKQVDWSALFELFVGRVENEAISETWLLAISTGIDADFVNCANFSFPLRIPDEIPKQVDTRFHELWQHCLQTIHSLEAPLKNKLLSQIYWTLGREAGEILSILHQNGVNWGTYDDSLCSHCNAHPNNLVILPHPSHPCRPPSSHHLLGVLDFDMAFLHSSYTGHDTLFETSGKLEESAMLIALAGDSNLNSGSCGEAPLSPSLLNAKWALRDTMMYAFKSAMGRQSDAFPAPPHLHEAVHALVQMSLMITETFIA